jgi:serine/threonine protein kinase
MNKYLNSNSTEYESEQNSKLNSLKIGQFIYNNNNHIYNTEYNNISDYKIIKQIGRGTFGHIFMVENEKKEFFALKKIIACSLQEIQILKHEYQILFELNSSEEKINLVSILKIETKQLDPTTFVMYVLMELSNTDWEKEILNRQKTLNFYTENQLLSIMSSLLKTFAFLQKKNISHRDIKPQNILVFNNNKYKLADFGEAKELIDNSKVTEKRTLRGTELYMSPILFNALRSRKPMKYVKHNTYKSDVFSFGLCLLFAGSLCFDILYDIRELKNNISIFVVVEKYLRFKYSDSVVNIISKMLDLNEHSRCDFVQLEKEFNNIGYY